MLKTKRKRLFIDIETSPNIGFFWRAGYKQQISYSNIIHERKIICICYKWEDEKEVYKLDWGAKQCDKKLVQLISEVLEQATEIVHHNGDRFDLPWIRTRALFHGLDMPPHYTTVDTLKLARKKFYFNSNKLDYVASFLGIGSKIKTTYDLWRKVVLDKSKTALADMVKYCQQDVKLLEEVYKKLRPHTEATSHYGVIFGHDRATCPECGSDEIVKINSRTTKTGLKKIQFKCNTCGTYHSKTDK